MELAQGILSSRRGSTILGILAAAVAGILLLVYISQYRDSVNSSNKTVQVIVARSLIQKGTPGDLIGSSKLFQPTSIAKDQVREGAFLDSSALHGKVATADIFPGQQLTASDFSVATAATISTKLTGRLRAISVPVDSARGLVGNVQTGDHVDVLASISNPACSCGVVREIIPNALVLRGTGNAGGGGLGGGGLTIILRATAHQAAAFAWASDNGKIWVILRPGARAVNQQPIVVTSDTILKGVK